MKIFLFWTRYTFLHQYGVSYNGLSINGGELATTKALTLILVHPCAQHDWHQNLVIRSVVDTIFTVLSTCRNDFVLLPPFPWLYSANEWHNYEIQQRVLVVDYLVPVGRFALNRTFSRLWSMKWTCCVVTDSVSQFHYFLSILQSSCSVNLVPDLNCSNQSVIYYYLNIRVCQGTWCHWWSRKWYIIAWLTQTIYSFIFYL